MTKKEGRPSITKESLKDPEILDLLIDAGADVNEEFELGRTPLMLASRYKSSPEIIKLLIDAGADVSAKDELGFTPLMLAAPFADTPKVLQLLIDAGANVDEASTPIPVSQTIVTAPFFDSEILEVLKNF